MMTPDSAAKRVTSPDGTPIAYWSSGEGPPLLLVHGAMSDHRRWRVTPWLEPHRTVHLMDRRGRGSSGDAPAWSLDREVEDVVAVIEAVAEEAQTPVEVLGHSLGGLLALRAAARSPSVRRLIVYEPSLDEPAQPPDLLDRMRALLAQDDRDAASVLVMREVVRMPEAEIATMRSLPSWSTRLDAAHTLPRELAVDLTLDPVEARRVGVPTLLLVGSDSPAFVQDSTRALADVLPDATIVVIDGQQHVADQLVPDVFARLVLEFLVS